MPACPAKASVLRAHEPQPWIHAPVDMTIEEVDQADPTVTERRVAIAIYCLAVERADA